MATTNQQAADVLFNVATILELSGDNPYRIRAYRRAARLLMAKDGHLSLTKSGELDIHGLGQRMRKRLGELVMQGAFDKPGFAVIDDPA